MIQQSKRTIDEQFSPITPSKSENNEVAEMVEFMQSHLPTYLEQLNIVQSILGQYKTKLENSSPSTETEIEFIDSLPKNERTSLLLLNMSDDKRKYSVCEAVKESIKERFSGVIQGLQYLKSNTGTVQTEERFSLLLTKSNKKLKELQKLVIPAPNSSPSNDSKLDFVETLEILEKLAQSITDIIIFIQSELKNMNHSPEETGENDLSLQTRKYLNPVMNTKDTKHFPEENTA